MFGGKLRLIKIRNLSRFNVLTFSSSQLLCSADMPGGTEKNCKSPVRIESIGLPFEPRSTDWWWLTRTAVTLTVLVQEMADCQLFITSSYVLQLEIVCWNSVISCVQIISVIVVACCAQIWCQASYTHTEHRAHDDQGEVTDAVMFFIGVFCARLAWWYRQLSVLSRLKLCLSVDDGQSLCKQLQAVSVMPVHIV